MEMLLNVWINKYVNFLELKDNPLISGLGIVHILKNLLAVYSWGIS